MPGQKENLVEEQEACALWEVKPVYFPGMLSKVTQKRLLFSPSRRSYKMWFARKTSGCLLACRQEHVLVTI